MQMKTQEHNRLVVVSISYSYFSLINFIILQSINIDSNSHMTANTNEIIILINTFYELRLRLLDGWLGVKMIQLIHTQ